ncbi:MAG: MotA/TolQ/ExbB proton channel family protein [Planctomycetaceae bacterium]
MMIPPDSESTTSQTRLLVPAIGLLFVMLPLTSIAQQPANGDNFPPPVDVTETEAEQPVDPAQIDAAGGAVVTNASEPVASEQAVLGASSSTMPSLWDLAIQGGWFMIPIGIASIITIAFTMERFVGLRRGRILPRKLIRRIRELMTDQTLDPRKLWEAAEQRRSPLANVVKVAVLKTGRPHAEVEKAVEDAVQREVGFMTRNLRPINVVASIAPLLGLLGTVQGMILAFMVTSTTTSTGTAKAQELAHGIYTALVTTFAGLTVAVVSVILANFLEGRIEKTLQFMEAIFLDLLPGLERYEGRVRITESTVDGEGIRIRQLTQAERPTATQAVAAHAAVAQSVVAAQSPVPERAVNPRAASSGKGVRSAKVAKTSKGVKPIRRTESPLTSDEVGSTVTDSSSTAARSLRSHFDG